MYDWTTPYTRRERRRATVVACVLAVLGCGVLAALAWWGLTTPVVVR